MLATLLRKLELTAENAAIDSTGMEPTTRSEHDDMQSGGRRKQYVKLSLVILCGVLMPYVLVISRGPCNDKIEAGTLLTHAAERIRQRGRSANRRLCHLSIASPGIRDLFDTANSRT